MLLPFCHWSGSMSFQEQSQCLISGLHTIPSRTCQRNTSMRLLTTVFTLLILRPMLTQTALNLYGRNSRRAISNGMERKGHYWICIWTNLYGKKCMGTMRWPTLVPNSRTLSTEPKFRLKVQAYLLAPSRSALWQSNFWQVPHMKDTNATFLLGISIWERSEMRI